MYVVYQSIRWFKKGCTKYLNLYGLNVDMARIVDSPGYALLNFSKRTENNFKKLLKVYLTESSRLTKIFWCIETELGLTEEDRVMFNFLKNLQIPIQMVFTKFDKVYAEDGMRRIYANMQLFTAYEDIVSPYVNIVSTKNDFGIRDLQKSVKHAILEGSTRKVDMKAGRVIYQSEESFTEFERENFRLLIDDGFKSEEESLHE